MDIKNTAISAKVVIESLICLLENENVDISSIKFKVGSDSEGYENPELELQKLIDLTLKGLEEVKAQAVPEGFVLVLKELPDDIAENMAKKCVVQPRRESNPIWIKIEEDAYKSRLQTKKWELWRDYKTMIEAQEQSHE